MSSSTPDETGLFLTEALAASEPEGWMQSSRPMQKILSQRQDGGILIREHQRLPCNIPQGCCWPHPGPAAQGAEDRHAAGV